MEKIKDRLAEAQRADTVTEHIHQVTECSAAKSKEFTLVMLILRDLRTSHDIVAPVVPIRFIKAAMGICVRTYVMYTWRRIAWPTHESLQRVAGGRLASRERRESWPRKNGESVHDDGRRAHLCRLQGQALLNVTRSPLAARR